MSYDLHAGEADSVTKSMKGDMGIGSEFNVNADAGRMGMDDCADVDDQGRWRRAGADPGRMRNEVSDTSAQIAGIGKHSVSMQHGGEKGTAEGEGKEMRTTKERGRAQCGRITGVGVVSACSTTAGRDTYHEGAGRVNHPKGCDGGARGGVEADARGHEADHVLKWQGRVSVELSGRKGRGEREGERTIHFELRRELHVPRGAIV